MEELKPCPFCGGGAHVRELRTCDFILYSMSCETPRCYGFESQVWFSTPDAAAEAWNRRAERTCTPIEVLEEGEFGLFIHHDCSECHEQLGLESWPNYCQNCGARVIEEDSDEGF